MNIAIDFDDVLTDTNSFIIAKYNHTFDTDYDINQFTEWDYSGLLGVEPKVLSRFIDITLKDATIDDLLPVESSLDAIYEISQRHTLSILSARGGHHVPFMVEWASTYFPGVFQYVFATNGAPKWMVMPQLEFRTLVDDNEDTIRHCHLNNVGGILYDRPHNQNYETGARVTDWNDLDKFLRDYGQ